MLEGLKRAVRTRTDDVRSRLARRSGSGTGSRGRAVLGWIAGIVILLLILYYPIGMAVVHEIDDDTSYVSPIADTVENGSRAVAITASLINREVKEKRWVANDPFFLPGAALDNMPAYQQGIVAATARFAFVLVDQIGRTRGSSETDPDLQEAAGQLQYAGNIWHFDLSTSLAPTTTSEARYMKARRSLLSYNARLSDGEAIYERRSDNLQSTLDRFALDLGASSAAIERHIDERAGDWLDMQADEIFYNVKGQVYAYFLLMRELGKDFDKLMAERELHTVYQQLLTSLEQAAKLQPLVVVNGRPDAQMQPSHLAALGFYLMRARTKLREITSILQK